MKLSCIMANYNTDVKMLTEALESILRQSYLDFELIVVDDASTDNSKEVLEHYAEIDDRVRIIENDNNLGLAYSLNRAIKSSKGDYIARMDTDDIAIANRFEIQVKYLDENPDIDICGSFARVFGAKNYFSITPFYGKEFCKVQLLYSSCLIHPTVMIRRKFLEDSNLLYNTNYLCSQDFELWSRAIEYGNIAMINQVLLYYRVHNGQISSKKRLLQRNYAIEICKNQIEKIIKDISDEQMEIHLVLCGHNELTNSNVENVFKWINNLIAHNKEIKVYDSYVLRKMLYNRMFNILMKSSLSSRSKLKVLLRHKSLLSITNIYSVLYRINYPIWNRRGLSKREPF